MATDDPRIAQIIALDEARRAAMIAEDFATLDRLLAPAVMLAEQGIVDRGRAGELLRGIETLRARRFAPTSP